MCQSCVKGITLLHFTEFPLRAGPCISLVPRSSVTENQRHSTSNWMARSKIHNWLVFNFYTNYTIGICCLSVRKLLASPSGSVTMGDNWSCCYGNKTTNRSECLYKEGGFSAGLISPWWRRRNEGGMYPHSQAHASRGMGTWPSTYWKY